MIRLSSLKTSTLVLMVAASSQAQTADTIKRLQEVVVQGYFSRQPIVQSPASVSILNSKDLNKTSGQSLLPAVNSVPGVRMEERSPGSYRLSIRGSLLRSPFGIRNVKVYLHDIPLTDASGNTYLNLLDPALIGRVEILKGPDGSLFGANSGGVVLLGLSSNHDSTGMTANISGGSYGLFREDLSMNWSRKKFQWTIGHALQRADGYRQQSFMKRQTEFISGKWKYKGENKLSLLMLRSDLHYETPGGLNIDQFKQNPAQARPAAGPNPGAVEQHAGIYNKTFLFGLTNTWQVTSSMRNVTTLFSSFTNYKNPFITNYETRKEKNVGLRTYFEYVLTNNNFNLQWNTGLEGQRGIHDIANYENNGGKKGALQSSDDFDVRQLFYFTRMTVEFEKLTAEMAISFNQYQYHFEEGSKKLSHEWMPRAALSYRIIPELAIRVSVSRGYSPPTLAEVRPSGAVINNTLKAENGWNKEIGIRLHAWNERIQVDASLFRFDLKNAIVRRTDINDVEYFINAGGTEQTGVEWLIHFWLMNIRESGIVRGVELNSSYTYNHFIFDDYQSTDTDFSGNDLTGVPENILVIGATLHFPKQIRLFLQSNMTARIPLNDANTAYAKKYHLLQAKVNWPIQFKRFFIEAFAGADNLLNEKYSLGNDINAFGGRYYNAAPLRNFYGGLTVSL